MKEETCTLLEFARMLGGSLPYVKRLHRDGRLVMADGGQVLVQASLAQLGKEGDGPIEPDTVAATPPVGVPAPAVPSYAESRARKEYFLALAAERDYRLSIRELAPTAFMEDALTRCAVRAGALFDSIPGLLRRRNTKLTSTDLAEIEEVISKVRNIVGGLSLRDLFDESPDAVEKALADAATHALPPSPSPPM